MIGFILGCIVGGCFVFVVLALCQAAANSERAMQDHIYKHYVQPGDYPGKGMWE